MITAIHLEIDGGGVFFSLRRSELITAVRVEEL